MNAGRELDMLFLKSYGWDIVEGVVEYEDGTTRHDCATYPGDMVYTGKHDAWILTHLGDRKAWAYRGNDFTYSTACCILADYASLPHISTNVTDTLHFLRLRFPFTWRIAESVVGDFDNPPGKWEVSIRNKEKIYGYAFHEESAFAICRCFQDFQSRFPLLAEWRFPK